MPEQSFETDQDTIYSVYIKINKDDYITAIDSNAYITDFSGWIKVAEGRGHEFKDIKKHNNLIRGLRRPNGLWNYKYANGRAIYKPQSMMNRDHNEFSAVEKDYKATRNYESGALVTIGGRLFKVTNSIPSGSKIVVGENVTETTMEQYINSKINGKTEEQQ